MQRHKVLVIDDEQDNREHLSEVLSSHFEVMTAADGEEGISKAREMIPDIVLLDIGMPKVDGITVCEVLRNNDNTRHIPVIMLTASNDPEVRTQAFERGADDYIPKPFKTTELVARVKSKARRIHESKLPSTVGFIQCGNLLINSDKLEATLDGARVELSLLEFNLLKYLVENKDKVLSRDNILHHVWKDSVVSDRTVDTHMVSLRKRLSGFDHKLSTIYGAGYVLKKD